MESLINMSCVITSVLVFFVTIMATSKRGGKVHTHGTLSIFVADVPDKFVTGVWGKGPRETELQYGHTSFGALLSVEYEQWATNPDSLTAWYVEQIKTSQLRTYDAASADIIFVPAMLDVMNSSQHHQFITEADQFLPHLTTKPHVLVLPQGPGWFNSTLFLHNSSQNFVFVAWGNMTGLMGSPWKADNIVGYPAFTFIHWSRGSKHLQTQEQVFDAEATAKRKTKLVFQSFIVRGYPDRLAVHKDCTEAPDLCTHFDWNKRRPSDATAVYEAYRSAWYVIHPRGDTITRNSLFDTLLADAVPVYFQHEYWDSVPFTDMVDWNKMAVYIPEYEMVRTDGNRTNPIQKLAEEFDKSEVLLRLEYIHGIRHLFQYMQNPAHELIRWEDRSTIHSHDDAFTFTMKSVLRNLCSRGLLPEKCGLRMRRLRGRLRDLWGS